MLVSVRFGSGQQRIFNINCQTAPLLDAISEGCYADMASYLKKREEVVSKELGAWRKKEASLLKKLEKLEPKQDESGPKAQDKKGRSRQQVKIRKKGTKKKEEKPPEEEKKEETPEPPPVEEKKEAKGKKGKEEPVEPPKELTEEEKKAKEISEIKAQIEENKATQGKIQAKIEAIKSRAVEVTADLKTAKVLDLADLNGGERKFMATKADQFASEFLTEKMSYQLQRIRRTEEEEEVAENVEIDRKLVMTLEEEEAAAKAEEEADPKAKKKK